MGLVAAVWGDADVSVEVAAPLCGTCGCCANVSCGFLVFWAVVGGWAVVAPFDFLFFGWFVLSLSVLASGLFLGQSRR